MRELDRVRVLILDDDPGVGDLLTSYLQLTGVQNPIWLDHSEKLWEELQQSSYDILLLDYRLGDTNGLDVLRQMAEKNIRMPVIMLTGAGDERVAALAIQLGAKDYLIKSYDFFQSLPSLILKAIQSFQLEQSVLRSLEKISYQALLLNNIRDALVVWNTQGVITFWNQAASEIFGHRAEEQLGQSVHTAYFYNFLEPPDLEIIKQNSCIETERCFLDRDQKNIWISSRISILVNADNKEDLIGYMDVSRDITDLKEVEHRLRENEEKLSHFNRELEALYQTTLEINSQHNLQSLLQSIIERAVEILNGSSGKLFLTQPPGQEIRLVVSCLLSSKEEGGPRFEMAVARKVAQMGQPVVLAGQLGQENDPGLARIVPLRLLGMPLKIEDEVIGIILINDANESKAFSAEEIRLAGLFADQAALAVNNVRLYEAARHEIAERKLVETHLIHTQAQLAQSARSSAIGELASGVAHQIYNPLTTIIAEAQMLRNQIKGNETAIESVQAIETAGWRAQGTVQLLMEFSQPPSSAMESVDINATIAQAVKMVGESLQAQGVQISTKLDGNLPHVRASLHQLQNLWMNLLLVARASTVPESSPSVNFLSFSTEEGQPVVEMKSQGILFPEVMDNPLLDPGQANRSLDRVTGLELNICHEIVRQLQGSINLIIQEDSTLIQVLFPREIML